MITLRMEHKISNYDGWKKAFDSDPLNRKKSGVKHYRIFRPTDDETFVVIDLEFDNLNEAQTTKTALQNMWTKIEGTLIFKPQIRILDIIESKAIM